MIEMNNTYYIHRLHICNFKSFPAMQKERDSYVTIDFYNKEDAIYKSMILTGPNGYGKTSIFQAIAFALTGQLELSVYAEKNNKFIDHVIISDLNKEAFVAVEFVDENNQIKTVLRYTKKGKASKGNDLKEEAKDFDAYIISGKFNLEDFKKELGEGKCFKVTIEDIASEFGEKNVKEWLKKNYIQQEYGFNIIFQKDVERVNFLNKFIDAECDTYFDEVEEEKKKLQEKIKEKEKDIKQLYKDTKGEQKDIIGEKPECGKILENMEILWDKEEYNSKEPFDQYKIKAENFYKFVKQMDIYQTKKCCEIAEELKDNGNLVKKIVLSKFESGILQEYKKEYEKKVYLAELIQSEDNLMTKDLEERYLNEQQLASIQTLRKKKKDYTEKADEREQIYLQMEKARREIEGKEKLVEEIFQNVCPTCGHDYEKDNSNTNLSNAIMKYQKSFDAMKNMLNSTLKGVHDEVKNEIVRIQKELQDISQQLDFNPETRESILDFEKDSNRYHQYCQKYLIMCELQEEVPEVSEAKELLEDKNFYTDIANLNQLEEKSKKIIAQLEKVVEKAKQFLAGNDNLDEILYNENKEYLIELKGIDIAEICIRLEKKIKQLEWLFKEQKSKDISEKRKKLEKNINEIRDWYIREKKLDKLLSCKTESQKEYKNDISKLIEIPLYIYSGKLIQTHQNGLGVFCYTGEEQLTQFKLCNTGVKAKERQDITKKFSAGQKAVVNIALMLAFRKISHSNIDVFLIDDPCQSMDDLNIASLIEILKMEFPKTQVIVSSHEDEIAGYMYYKYAKIGRRTRLYNVQKEMYALWNLDA